MVSVCIYVVAVNLIASIVAVVILVCIHTITDVANRTSVVTLVVVVCVYSANTEVLAATVVTLVVNGILIFANTYKFRASVITFVILIFIFVCAKSCFFANITNVVCV